MNDPYGSLAENEVGAEEKPRRWPVKAIACLLLLVMLCGIISTPLAILLYWNTSRQERPLPTAVPADSAESVEPDESAQTESVNRIAYITPEQQLATIAPDGTSQRLLTGMEQFFQFPAWSPDNSRLAVIGSEQDGVGVYVIPDQSGSELQTLYYSESQPPFYLYWSPDSSRVSFLANHPSGIGFHIGDVLAETSRLLATGQPFYWDWTPSGDQILIHSGFSGEDSRLALIDPNGEGEGDNISAPGFFQAPGISSDGRLWAYAQVDEDDNSQLTILDAESGQLQQTEAHSGLIAMSWSPAADLLAYITPGIEAPVFYGPLHLLDAVTGESRVIAEDLVIAFFWSPNGRYIAYFTVAETDDSAIQAAIPGKTSQAGKRNLQEGEELFLEVWLVDTLEGSVRRLRTFEPTDLFVFQFLPFFDQYSLSHRIWSPDSSALVLPVVERDTPRITILPIDGREAGVIVDGIIGFWSR